MEYLQMNQMVVEFYDKDDELETLPRFVLSIPGSMDQHFTCATDGFIPTNDIIKLYLSTHFLNMLLLNKLSLLVFSFREKVQCFFLSRNSVSSVASLNMFTSGGLAPSLSITNSTYTGIFHFNLTLSSDRIYWLINIPRENITQNTDVAAVEEWSVRISLQHGLDIYTTEGTLLDIVREPILQSRIGVVLTLEEITEMYPFVKGLKVAKSPCANDVALVGFILNTNYSGIYVGLTYSGFWDIHDTIWYNLTDSVYIGYETEHLTLIDMVFTNEYIILLTSTGLFVSDIHIPRAPRLKFSRIEFCGFERVRYFKFPADYVSITFDRNRTLSESSSCFYSSQPFRKWLPCLHQLATRQRVFTPRVISFLVDQEHKCGIYLLYKMKQTSAMVNTFKYQRLSITTKFPTFTFPRSFSKPMGMVFHPRSHFLYAYGNEIWLSMDGGNTFKLIASLYYEYIRETYHSFYTSDVIFISERGNIYRTKAGLNTYEKFGVVRDAIFAFYYDHLGFLHKLTPNLIDLLSALAVSDSFNMHFSSSFCQSPDLGFTTALAPQLLTFHEIIFFAYVPLNEPQISIPKKKFSSIHQGKVITYSKTGRAHIKKILFHNNIPGFLSSVIAEIIRPFGVERTQESSCLRSSLRINPTDGLYYLLTLKSYDPSVISMFEKDDAEKTVVIIGYSSFLITKIINDTNALALPTMPSIVPKNMTFRSKSWFLYDFGLAVKRKWNIFTNPCNYWLQPLDDSLALNVQKYIDLGESQTFKVKVIPSLRGVKHLEAPQLKIIAGNAHLFHIQTKGSYDDIDHYVVEVTLTSRSFDLGFISLAFVIWDASTKCFVTTVIPTLKSSCSYIKSMHHIPYIHIPKEDWIKGVHEDSQGFNLIKTLPANYRPPSNKGIAIPLTNNFYHADPSKPIPRNLFPESRKRGQYKQCAGASSREGCYCTEEEKYSYAVAFSDCREKVPRFKYPVTNYPVTLEIHNKNGNIPVARPYLVTVSEVNHRGNWKLKYSIPNNIKRLKEYTEFIFQVPVYNPEGLNLSIEGSELYHFRVSVIEGISFCELVEEFQIYVDEVPLPFPGHTLIAMAAAVLLGGLIIIAFMLQMCDIHPWDMLQNLIRRQDVYHPNFHDKEMKT
ncbi:LOW QUALITY PROTEIN: cation channel sperm-associated auxiliary subunit beta [Sorex araneus]|uniref:LOW QUALITY PROTEIN: cation channel sperm-associated auxiliary subunit beta n=1 Tax=Sorex araneus TaxID=42254 RepID=UPI002433914B|nr:LOW QUALITY PROTEIN: cation channel sperm-associated auxiliary subunit beta [Sorex araneus]